MQISLRVLKNMQINQDFKLNWICAIKIEKRVIFTLTELFSKLAMKPI